MDLTFIILVGIALLVITAVIIIALNTQSKQQEKPLPYRTKKYFFTRSEQEFLRLLNEAIDRHKFTIFPKVRLADFIEVTERGKESQGWWNKIKSKHIDFLVWDVLENKIALAIELDGRSHQSEKAIASDDFKNRLYERVGIKLLRIDVGTNFVQKAGEIKTLLQESTVTTNPTATL